MKVTFWADDQERVGEIRDLSAMGLFVMSEASATSETIELKIETAAEPLVVWGNVVRATSEGFAVAFGALPPVILSKLDWLIHGEGPFLQEETPLPDSLPLGEVPALQGEGWKPPVSEPSVHQWKPEADFLQPPPGKPEKPAWEYLPTLSPPPIEMKSIGPVLSTAKPAPPPPEPEAFDVDFAAPPAPSPQPAPAAAPIAAAAPSAPPPAAERRQEERSEQSIPITFDNLTSLIKEFTHNISFGGLFVFTDRALKTDEEIAVTLIHPVHGERLTLVARVVHAATAPQPDPVSGAPRYGVGVEFKIPVADLKRKLSDFISSHQKPKKPTDASQVALEARAMLSRGARSHHDLLDVTPTATQDEIRRAYFMLVDRFHPDRHYGKVSESDQKMLEELFRQLTKAYETLTA